jgi:D-xylose 1-dehydrogenase (NADP+, D-xylono-1,5-lactone-forming)
MHCNWGVIGPGFIATRAVIPAIQQLPNAHVLAVASSNKERAQSIATQFDIERSYDDYGQLLADPDLNAIYIALPNHLHHNWTIRAAQAGKHVLCEKPLAMTAAECDEMIAACQRAHVLLMEAVMYRFHPRMQYLKHLLTSGACGEIRFVHSAFSFPFDSPGNYRNYAQFGGGALLDVGSYCINAARWLVGYEPQAIAGISYSHNGVDLSTTAILRFEQDVLAHIQCSFAAAEYQVIEVVGSVAAVMAPLAFTAWRDDATVLLIQQGSSFEQKEFVPADPYQAMVAHFTECVLGQSSLLYPASDGHATLDVVDKIRKTVM